MYEPNISIFCWSIYLNVQIPWHTNSCSFYLGLLLTFPEGCHFAGGSTDGITQSAVGWLVFCGFWITVANSCHGEPTHKFFDQAVSSSRQYNVVYGEQFLAFIFCSFQHIIFSRCGKLKQQIQIRLTRNTHNVYCVSLVSVCTTA